LPMHYGTKVYMDLQSADEFLDEQKNVREIKDSNLLDFPADLKSDKPTVIILGWTQPKG